MSAESADADAAPTAPTASNLTAEQWAAYAPEFAADGTLRDLYVGDTDLGDWFGVARFLNSAGYTLRFTGGWEGDAFPANVGRLFTGDPTVERTDLTVDVAGVRVVCHFFCVEHVELDLDPAEVVDATRLAAIFELMRGLAGATGKDVLLTPENLPERPIFRVRAGVEGAEYVGH